MPPADAHGFAVVYAASQRKSGAGNALISVSLILSDEKIDRIYYSIIKLHKDLTEYDLIWHEDVGNYIFSVKQDEASIMELEKRLEVIVIGNDKIVVVSYKLMHTSAQGISLLSQRADGVNGNDLCRSL